MAADATTMPESLRSSIFQQRRGGVVLHPTSLPEEPGGGFLGLEAFRFVDWLSESGLTVWQVLPLGPTHQDLSPYMSPSAHAGNPRLISRQRLVECGWLGSADRTDSLDDTIARAYAGFQAKADPAERMQYQDFLAHQASWLDDYALYRVLHDEQHGRSWVEWPPELRERDAAALAAARVRLAAPLDRACFEQFIFFRQWHDLRAYANGKGVLMFGDMPIFVAHDSADVWAHRDCFDLDETGRARSVAGVPPDYFSATGQRWGNPHYRWEHLRATGFQWWVERMRSAYELYDLVRIDHFRGFEAYWEIPATAQTAIEGRWVKVDGVALFDVLRAVFHDLPLVAEDLGIITPEVDALRRAYGLPGMKILQFAFDGSASNPYLPHNHQADFVVYTGTHDNDTTLSWYQGLPDSDRNYVDDYLGYRGEAMPWALVRAGMASTARLAMFPLQDLLGLGAGHRMNTPGVVEGNWAWRFAWSQVDEQLSRRIRHWLQLYGRC